MKWIQSLFVVSNYLTFVLFCCSLYPIQYLFFVFWISIPYQDDLAMLPVLNASWLDPFWQQTHNEHLLLVHKLYIWLLYFVFQSHYIKWGLLFNFLLFLAIFYLILRKVFSTHVVPIFIGLALVASPSLYENMNWLLCSSQHMVIFVFFISCVYFFTKSEQKIGIWDGIWGILFLVMTFFSSGNGILTLAIISLLLLYQRRYPHLLIVLGSMFLSSIYLIKSTQVHFLNPWQIARQFSYLIESPYAFISHPKALKAIQLLFLFLEIRLIFCLVISRIRKEKINQMGLIFYLLHLFAIGNLVLMAAFRPIDQHTIPDRYRIYILMVWLTLLYFNLLVKERQFVLYPILGILVVFNFLEFDFVKLRAFKMYQEKKLILVNAKNGKLVVDEYYQRYFSSLVLTQHKRQPFEDCFEPSHVPTKMSFSYFPGSKQVHYLKNKDGHYWYE